SPLTRRELERLGSICRRPDAAPGLTRLLLDRLLPQATKVEMEDHSLQALLERYGFDSEQHEQIRGDLRNGRIGLAQNRLPVTATIEDVTPKDVCDVRGGSLPRWCVEAGEAALRAGEVGVVTLAAGVGSRWTEGAGVVKALHPFCKMAGKHRSFLEIHLAKSRRTGRRFRAPPVHIFTTGYLTDRPIRDYLAARGDDNHDGAVYVSEGRSVGLRMIPTVRDLRFEWEEMPQQMLDEQQQKVRASLRAALLHWAQQAGEADDYVDNLPLQCLHPVGHWYEIPNMLRNGLLGRLLVAHPALKYLFLHNIDTLGASLDPGLLGWHITQNRCLTYEVIPRRLDDRGGGLARVDGHVRLLEGLAMPREEDEFQLSFYNSMSTWIDIDRLLRVFELRREELAQQARVDAAVRALGRRIPTYITLKSVKKRWGHGQEDVYPVSQFEKLWGDMTSLPEVDCGYVVTPLARGQQLKQPAQLDGWLRDGSADYVAQLCEWGD
ncbi:MAG: UTP--glucose-1-phosphate uridylyltransferase, partial [Pirellulaceae bacterium]